jgi:hypothetical protein
MKKLTIMTALLALLTVALASVALAAIAPDEYCPTTDSFNSANAPTHSARVANNSVDPACVVNADLSIDCNAYVLSGVGHTNATVLLVADYEAIIDCNNPAGEANVNNPIESHSVSFTAASTATVQSEQNGQLNVLALSVSPEEAPDVCPNPNWEQVFRGEPSCSRASRTRSPSLASCRPTSRLMAAIPAQTYPNR